jgi:hypothetical protein
LLLVLLVLLVLLLLLVNSREGVLELLGAVGLVLLRVGMLVWCRRGVVL